MEHIRKINRIISNINRKTDRGYKIWHNRIYDMYGNYVIYNSKLEIINGNMTEKGYFYLVDKIKEETKEAKSENILRF